MSSIACSTARRSLKNRFPHRPERCSDPNRFDTTHVSGDTRAIGDLEPSRKFSPEKIPQRLSAVLDGYRSQMGNPMRNTKRRLAVATTCLLLFGATACSSSGSKSSSTTTVGTSTPAALTIQNTSFGAASATAGTQFTIANKDTATHTVTDDAGSFDVRVSGGGTATLTIPKAGTYKIHCKIHSSMHGTITVA